MKTLQLRIGVSDEYLSTEDREPKRKTRESKGSALKTEINFN